MNEQALLHQLRSALMHLHDLDYLEAHPLAQRLPAGLPEEGATSRGLRLRTALIELIESLKPGVELPDWAPEWRRYVILHDRYVLRRPLWEIEEKLSLGDRQVRREHHRALAALAVLARSWLGLLPSPTTLPQPPVTVQEAVQRLSPAPRVFGLAQLFEEVVAILVEVSGQYSAVEWRVQPDDLTVYTDRGILHQLLIKLLRLFLRQGGDSRQVSLRACSDNIHVIIAVTSDTLRVQAGDEDLRLCQWLAQALRTEIHVEGEERGSRLDFVLPVGTRLRKVLIIDDELPAIELFEGYLNGLDYQVIGETVAEQALQRAVETQPDVIVLDVMMPAVDGWELLQRLRHAPPLQDVPIIVCSVLDDADLAFALGAARFLKKPVLRQQLVAALQEVCIQTPRPTTALPALRSTASPSPSD